MHILDNNDGYSIWPIHRTVAISQSSINVAPVAPSKRIISMVIIIIIVDVIVIEGDYRGTYRPNVPACLSTLRLWAPRPVISHTE